MTILLTGGTGTFGHAFIYETLRSHPEEKVRIFARDEFKQYEMRKLYPQDDRLTYILGDIRDRKKVDRAMWGVDVVVHAAALKQVPILEENPLEAVKTNVQGTVNVMEAAIDAGVKLGVMISTDKAVRPINTYGLSKALAEQVWRGAGAYMGGRGLDKAFIVCRFGNVVGSRGSVVGLWRQQIKAGESVTLTNGEMTRFIMTPLDAVQFVWSLIENEKRQVRRGSLYVPMLTSTTVNILADAVYKSEKRVRPLDHSADVIIGTRPGEKFHEELLSPDEMARAIDRIKYFEVPLDEEGGAAPWIDDAGYVSADKLDNTGIGVFAIVDRAHKEEISIWGGSK